MSRKVAFIIIINILSLAISSYAQNHTENKADQVLRGSGRVNASSLGMEFEVPLGGYQGRGITIPVSLSYSSKVWRMESRGSFPIPTTGSTNRCVNVNEAKFGENSASELHAGNQ
jgi:hypothetical protein